MTMRRRLSWLVLGAALSACPSTPVVGDGDSGPSARPFFQSGRRLRARLLKSEAGAIFKEFVDTGRGNEACAFTPTSTGEWRCLPNRSSEVFGDRDCSVPAGLVDSCLGDVGYVMKVSREACGPSRVTEVRRTDALLAWGTGYMLDSEGRCRPSGRSGARWQLRSLGEVVPLTDFVPAVAVTESLGAMSRERLLGEDGSELAVSNLLVDTARGALCAPSTDQVCVPFPWASSGPGTFAGPGCTARGGLFPSMCGAPVAGIRWSSVDSGVPGCPVYSPDYWSVGTPQDAGSLLSSDGVCRSSAGPSVAFLAPLDPPPTRLPERRSGSGPLELVSLTSGGVQVTQGRFTHRGLSCQLLRTSDGRQYCLPEAEFVPDGRLFRDSACTRQVVPVSRECVTAEFLLTPAAEDSECSTGSLEPTVRPLGPPTEVDTVYSISRVECLPYPGVTRVRDIGAPVPIGSVAGEVTTVVE